MMRDRIAIFASKGFRSADPSSSLGRRSACIGDGRCTPRFGPLRRASRKGMCVRRRARQSRGGGMRVAAVPAENIENYAAKAGLAYAGYVRELSILRVEVGELERRIPRYTAFVRTIMGDLAHGR